MTIQELVTLSEKHGTGRCRVRIPEAVPNPVGDRRVRYDLGSRGTIPAGLYDITIRQRAVTTGGSQPSVRTDLWVYSRGAVAGSVECRIWSTSTDLSHIRSPDGIESPWLRAALPAMVPVEDTRALLATFDVEAEDVIDHLLVTYPWLREPILEAMRAKRGAFAEPEPEPGVESDGLLDND